jgi:putative hydrolases of HD superfamily
LVRGESKTDRSRINENEKEMNKRDIEFLYEIGSLRNVQRGWRQHFAMDCANVLDHTMRVVWLALVIARKTGGADENKIIKMALVHDLAEARVSDLSYVQKVYVTADEHTASKEMFAGTTLENFGETLEEYEERQSLESKIVKDADNLDVDMELHELAERGSKLPEKWKIYRRKVRDEKLHTDAAKDLWDLLEETDVADWHMAANKWVRMPGAGK